jgi:predicted Rossmann fold flavoprotein
LGDGNPTFKGVKPCEIVIVGGGAAGFFASIVCAEACKGASVTLIEAGAQFLSKVRISGGGRCNVTHSCYDARQLAESYPRGGQALIGPFQRFQPRDVTAWFSERGVALKTEGDGRMFPITDSSQTIVDCLVNAARDAGVKTRLQVGLKSVTRPADSRFQLSLANGETLACDLLLLATGGCRSDEAVQLVESLGHHVEAPVPSLFTFNVDCGWLKRLSGVSLETVEVTVVGTGLRERGPILLTHWGLSGPVILRLSAWGARILQGLDYRFSAHINWLPKMNAETITAELSRRAERDGARRVVNTTLAPLSARLWEQLVLAAGVPMDMRWQALGRAARHRLVQQLIRTELSVTGKSTNKDEFVTCGGVRLNEVNFKTMESRICPGLYFAGELLDIDGITGGFNFQAAWTTGCLAGCAMAEAADRG